MGLTRTLHDQGKNTRFVFLLLDGFAHVSFACSIEPLRLANTTFGQPLYAWSTASINGDPVTSSCGIRVIVGGKLENLAPGATLVVIGGVSGTDTSSPALIAFLRRQHAHGVSLVGLCGGVEALAMAGLLNGQNCAVDWQLVHAFAERHPATRPTDQVFVIGKVSTAASGTAAADLILHLMGQEHGEEFASRVADRMSLTNVRQPGTRKRQSLNTILGVRNDILTGAIKIMGENIEEVLPIGQISDQLRISTRQLERVFARHLNTSPNRHYLAVRLERAASLLQHTDLSVAEIALSCGFSSTGQFSKCYQKSFGCSPSKFRVVQLSQKAMDAA